MSRAGKDPVQKCHSDPGAAGTLHSPSKRNSRRHVLTTRDCVPSSPNTRKCDSTLDGCSYVIGNKRKVKKGNIAAGSGLVPSTSADPAPSTSVGSTPSTSAGGAMYDEAIGGPSTSKLCNPASSDENGLSENEKCFVVINEQSDKNRSDSAPENLDNSSSSNNVDDNDASNRSIDNDDVLNDVDPAIDSLPVAGTPDACYKAACRLRCLLRQLPNGMLGGEIVHRNMLYAARVLEAVYNDETKVSSGRNECAQSSRKGAVLTSSSLEGALDPDEPQDHAVVTQKQKLSTPVNARRLDDYDDELTEVRANKKVSLEVRRWLASTFTRQQGISKCKVIGKPKFRTVAQAIRAGIFVERMYRKVISTVYIPFPQGIVALYKTLDDWSFDVFSSNEVTLGKPLKYLGFELLNRYGIIHKYRIPTAVLENFLDKIEAGYKTFDNPYHNNIHAADISQTFHYMLSKTGLMHWMSDIEIYASITAAIIHDYEHTGTTNNFHVMTGSDLAMLYNDQSVLENYHLWAAFRVLDDENCNILKTLTPTERREFRSLVVDMVLATDMNKHFKMVKDMRNLLSVAELSVDKGKVLGLLLHCCDISHPAKHWTLHRRWTNRLLEEFFRQGDMEKALHLPCSPLCDRENTLVAESQIGFIEFIVEPILELCSDMIETVLESLDIKPPNDGEESTESGFVGTGNGGGSGACKISKPWLTCLEENKRIWKLEAVREAMTRA